MPKKYSYCSRFVSKEEPMFTTWATSRLNAAKYFAKLKQLPLKEFLKLYKISK